MRLTVESADRAADTLIAAGRVVKTVATFLFWAFCVFGWLYLAADIGASLARAWTP